MPLANGYAEPACPMSEERYRFLAENAPCMLVLYDRQLRVVYLSTQAEQVTGIPTKEFIGRTNREVGMSEDFCNKWDPALEQVLSTGCRQSLEFDFPGPQGTRSFMVKLIPEFDQDEHAVLHVLGISIETTEHKRLEEDLKKVKNILFLTADGVSLVDKDYRYTIVNDAYEKFSGMDRKDLIGMTIPEYLGMEVFEKYVRPNFDKCLSGETVNYQQWFEYPTLGKRFVDVTYYPYRGGDKAISGIIAYTRDITERKHAEEALKESEERLRLAQHAGEVGVWDWWTQTGVKVFSDEMNALYGLPPGSIKTYEGWLARVHPDDKAAVLAKRDKALSAHEPFDLEFRILHASGEMRWIASKGGGLYDEEGRLTRVIGVSIDITNRKRAEEALKESEGRYRALFENLNAAAFMAEPVLDGNGRLVDLKCLMANPGVWKHLKKTPEELVGRRYSEVFSYPGRNPTFVICEGVLCSSEPYKGEIFLPAVNAHYDISVYRPAPNRLALILSDITERKHAEERLLKSEERFRLSMDATHDGLWDWDIVTDQVYFSPSCYRILGCQPGEFPGTIAAWKERIHPEDIAHVVQANVDCVEGHTDSFGVEYRMRACNGEWRWILGRGKCINRDENARATRLIGTNVDITERKRAEDSSRQAEEKARLLVEHAPSMIYEVDLRGPRVLNVNEVVCKTVGYSREELLQMNPLDLLVGESKRIFQERVASFLSGVLPSEEVEYTGRTKDGRIIYVALHNSFTFEDGQPAGVIVVAHDITERKRVEEELRQFNKTLETKVAERTALAEERTRQLQALTVELIETEERERRQFSDLLHDDLQQMLAAAKMQVQVVAETSFEPMLSSAVQTLEESIAKSRRLSHQLSPPILNQAGLIASLEWLSKQMKEQFGLKVDLQLNTELLMERTPQKIFLFRAAQELLFNILKHAGVKEAKVEVTSSEDSIVVSVSDQGRGFDPQILEQPTGHLSLGLLTIKERANHIGGAFAIESAPGQGSRFTLTVPNAAAMNDQEAAAEAAAAEMPKFPLPKTVGSCAGPTRVLFVDDHNVMRLGLIKLVKGQPAIQVVGQASNGREALEQARKLMPDVIVMDISMPEMDGIEATRLIKAEFPAVRIIGLTMHNDPQLIASMQQAGAEATLSKTTSAAGLVKAIYGSH